jgi:hypothetical protein
MWLRLWLRDRTTMRICLWSPMAKQLNKKNRDRFVHFVKKSDTDSLYTLKSKMVLKIKLIKYLGQRDILQLNDIHYTILCLSRIYSTIPFNDKLPQCDLLPNRVVDEISLSRNFAKYLFCISRNNFLFREIFVMKLKFSQGKIHLWIFLHFNTTKKINFMSKVHKS